MRSAQSLQVEAKSSTLDVSILKENDSILVQLAQAFVRSEPNLPPTPPTLKIDAALGLAT